MPVAASACAPVLRPARRAAAARSRTGPHRDRRRARSGCGPDVAALDGEDEQQDDAGERDHGPDPGDDPAAGALAAHPLPQRGTGREVGRRREHRRSRERRRSGRRVRTMAEVLARRTAAVRRRGCLHGTQFVADGLEPVTHLGERFGKARERIRSRHTPTLVSDRVPGLRTTTQISASDPRARSHCSSAVRRSDARPSSVAAERPRRR